jgi:hypothetical protein
MHRAVSRLSYFIILLGAVLAMGCAGSSRYMREVDAPAPLNVQADKATVVFLRPSGLGFAINFAILDQEGNWIGDAVAKSHFTVALASGEYMFVGWAENTAAMKATLVAGRIYYVEVTPLMGLASARVELNALTPRAEDWKSVPQWMRETKALEPLPTGAAYIKGRNADALHRIASATENWSGYSPVDRDKHTLRADDGVAADTTPKAPVAQSNP